MKPNRETDEERRRRHERELAVAKRRARAPLVALLAELERDGRPGRLRDRAKMAGRAPDIVWSLAWRMDG
jgi:hypothetical protein